MPITITTPEGKKEVEISSLTRKQLKAIRDKSAANPDMKSEDYHELVIDTAGVDFSVSDDEPLADLAYVSHSIMRYSTGGPDAVKN